MKYLFIILTLCFGTSAMAATKNNKGIQISSVRLSAAGNMLDLRYRINDIQKAKAVLIKGIKPYMIEEKTGAQLYIPAPGKVGPLRQLPAQPSKDKTYFMIFANPGRSLKRGDMVTVVLGDYKVQHVAIQ